VPTKAYDFDSFISYAGFDNVSLSRGRPGWVEQLERSLQTRLQQLRGQDIRLWIDSKALLGRELHRDALSGSATFVCILSPAYLASPYCRQELDQILELSRPHPERLFKVLKLPIPDQEQPAPLNRYQGYSFFRCDSRGRAHELSVDGATHRPFVERLSDLAYDLARVLQEIRDPVAVPGRQPLDKPADDLNRAGFVVTDPEGETRRLRVFLCHSSADKSRVRPLYDRLTDSGIGPWLDERDLLPGQRWQEVIPRAVRESDAVVVCISKGSAERKGYLQKEILTALDAAEEQPEGAIYLIPAKLEECDVPERLRPYQWVNLFDEPGYAMLLRALRRQATNLSFTPELRQQR
jgi:hypothetical protein